MKKSRFNMALGGAAWMLMMTAAAASADTADPGAAVANSMSSIDANDTGAALA